MVEPRRKSLRLRSWDYSWPWWYYVTIVVKDRESVLGEVFGDRIFLNEIGTIVKREVVANRISQTECRIG
jgi:hypothetical protein